MISESSTNSIFFHSKRLGRHLKLMSFRRGSPSGPPREPRGAADRHWKRHRGEDEEDRDERWHRREEEREHYSKRVRRDRDAGTSKEELFTQRYRQRNERDRRQSDNGGSVASSSYHGSARVGASRNLPQNAENAIVESAEALLRLKPTEKPEIWSGEFAEGG